ncbi:MAG: FdhF/YdeP family oxidoreductase [Bacteroidia bacterium]|nr:FdhF/YdeP family oxidoreductase [Bacteroidia bacterium]
MKNNETPPVPQAEPPKKFTGIRLSKPEEKAAGLPAVFIAMQQVYKEAGIKRGLTALSRLNQKGGTDCPSCAWPDPDDERSRLGEFCENGAKAIAEEATAKRLTPDFFRENSICDLSLLNDFEIGRKGRIAQPMYLPKGGTHYQEISWQNAFEKIAESLNQLNSPDEAIFYTSGRTSNEAAFLYQLFIREFGTNNMPDCSNMCHESSGVALIETVGIGKGSVKLEDFYETEVILIIGQNPGTNHPRMLSALQKAKKNGATIISINPLKEAGLVAFANPQQVVGLLGSATSLTDVYLQVKINGDMALLKAILLLLLDKEEKNPGSVFDLDFIREKTVEYESFIQNLRKENYEDLLILSGIRDEEVRKVAEILATRKKIISCWAMGLTQHKNAVATIQEIINLLLLKGSIGKPGAGTCPVRGHSNVQGDRTMGINERPSQAFLDNIERAFGFSPPQAHGYNTVEAIEAMYHQKAHVFIAMGGNFLSATPDTQYTAKALQNCRLTVQISTKLNRSHLIVGQEALILPCLGRTDKEFIGGELQFVSVENSMGVVHSSRGSLTPVSDKLMSEAHIVCNLAKATLGKQSVVNWDQYLQHYDFIRESIAQTIPGFKDYNEKIRIREGFYLPNCARENEYNTISGKARFTVSDIEPIRLQPHEFLMMTIRSHDQFNTTLYGLDDRYRGIKNERRVVLMNPEDIAAAGLKSGEVVNLYNYYGGKERVAQHFMIIPYDIPAQCIATYFPEANVLVPVDSIADKSHTPTSKSVVVEIKKD